MTNRSNEAHRQLEEQLAAFWDEMELFLLAAAEALDPEVQDLLELTEPFSVGTMEERGETRAAIAARNRRQEQDRTVALGPPVAGPARPATQSTTGTATVDADRPTTGEGNHGTDRRNFFHERREKAKTRPPPTLETRVGEPAAPPELNGGIARPRIRLSQARHAVLYRLMGPNERHRAGEIMWREIVDLLQGNGFQLRQREGGGVVRVFEPSPELRESQVRIFIHPTLDLANNKS